VKKVQDKKVSEMAFKVFSVNLFECPSRLLRILIIFLSKIFPLLCQKSSFHFSLIEATAWVPAGVPGLGVDHEQV